MPTSGSKIHFCQHENRSLYVWNLLTIDFTLSLCVLASQGSRATVWTHYLCTTLTLLNWYKVVPLLFSHALILSLLSLQCPKSQNQSSNARIFNFPSKWGTWKVTRDNSSTKRFSPFYFCHENTSPYCIHAVVTQ